MFADFYDSLTDNVEYEKRADYIVNVLEKNFNHDLGLTLDLACGTGTMTMMLKEKGIDVYGVDGSYDMLTVAQQKTMEKGLNILYLCQRMESLDLYGTIDTCICTLDSLNHIVDEKVFTKAIERVSLFMNKGGYFLFDLNTIYKHRKVLANNSFVFETDEVFLAWQNTLQENDIVDIDLDFFIKEEDNSKAHSQVSTDSVGTNEKIAIRTEAGQDPVYINAIPGLSRNPYDDDNFYTNKNGFIEYKHNGKNISTVGIDVSYAQGDIDWTKVKNAGVDFAMIRCGGRGYGTKGILYTDEKFKQNIEGATSAGIKVGVYFYSQAITAKEAKEEADYTLKLIKDYNIQYPVAYDWEHYENEEARTDELDRETLTNCAKTYCSEIEKSGYIPVIYANRSLLYYEYDLAKINNYEVWLASYEDLPDYYYEFGMWQYSTDGTIDGIEGTVDLNVCMYKY